MKPEIYTMPPPSNIPNGLEKPAADKTGGKMAEKLTLMDIIKSDEVGKYVNALVMPILILVSLVLFGSLLYDIKSSIRELNKQIQATSARAEITASRLDYIQAQIDDLKRDINDHEKNK